MKDTTPKIYDYIRLMQEYTPCVSEWQYQDKDGKWITASLDECLKHNQEDGAEWSEVKRFRNDLKQLIEVGEYQLPDVRFGNIEINADSVEKLRVEKMIKRIVASVDEPQYTDVTDLSHCKTWDEALAELEEVRKYRDYVEVCNSLRLLYNLLNPVVQEYLTKRKIIAGTGYSVGGYDNLTDYYKDVSQCKNLIKNGCSKIVVSVANGTITNISLTGRDGKDVLNIPLLDRRTDVRCRCNINEDYMCVIEKRPEQNISLQLLNLFVDPKHQWDNVKKMAFVYEIDSDYLYTFDAVCNNIANYLDAISKHEIQERNKFTQELCQRLECLYRFLRTEIKMSKSDSWEFICDLWKLPSDKDDVRMSILRYLGNYTKELPIQFVIKL